MLFSANLLASMEKIQNIAGRKKITALEAEVFIILSL